ncbi:MAG: ATP-binding cassette domain-containing protein [Gammaproteobacteria bacterium]|nr:ATP-binding cassette domain-containing protein [Gammaproteobacteria bacterium]
MALLQTRNLSVTFSTADGPVHAVNDISFNLCRGEILAIVGESGSGKSQTAFAIMGLLARNAHAAGSVRFGGKEILGLHETSMARIRASDIAMIFQNPMTSLNPYKRISSQMTEVLRLHQGLSRREARFQCIEMLKSVNLADAEIRFEQFPHECSGGMRQRIMIAMSLLCRPRILIADEPTTALDVTIQSQIVELLKTIRQVYGTTILLITHDLGLVAGCSDRVMVMYGGRVMETGPTEEIFAAPVHPYTATLLEAVPRLDREVSELPSIPGNPPNMLGPIPEGCPFSPRCQVGDQTCSTRIPEVSRSGQRSWACLKRDKGTGHETVAGN